MKKWLEATRGNILLHKLALVRALLYSFLTLSSAFLASVQNVDFPAMSHWNQFCLILGVFGSWSTVMIAFLDKTTARIQSGKAPMETGQTEFITKPPASN